LPAEVDRGNGWSRGRLAPAPLFGLQCKYGSRSCERAIRGDSGSCERAIRGVSGSCKRAIRGDSGSCQHTPCRGFVAWLGMMWTFDWSRAQFQRLGPDIGIRVLNLVQLGAVGCCAREPTLGIRVLNLVQLGAVGCCAREPTFVSSLSDAARCLISLS
jgi:hypothetical protein